MLADLITLLDTEFSRESEQITWIYPAVEEATGWQGLVRQEHDISAANSSAFVLRGLHWLATRVRLRRGLPPTWHPRTSGLREYYNFEDDKSNDDDNYSGY